MESRMNSSLAPRASAQGPSSSDGFKGKGAGFGLLLLWLVTTATWWGVAFFPVSQESPAWLVSLQAVCFGTRHDSLPEGFGWILLFVAPASFLLAVLAAYASEIKEDFASLNRSRNGRALLWVLSLVFVGELSWVGSRLLTGLNQRAIDFAPAQAGSLPAQYPKLNRPMPQFRLLNQTGETLTPDTFKGKTVLLSFVYAHCQTICPALVTTTTRALKALDEKGSQSTGEGKTQKTVALLITLDPWRDTPASLPSMAKRWELPNSVHLASASVPEVTQLLDALQVPWKRNEKTGEVDHPALFYVIDQNSKIQYAFNNPTISWITDAVARINH